MKDIFRFLGLGVGVVITSLAVACSSGSGNPTENEDASAVKGTGGSGAGGAGSATGGTTSTDACTPTVLYNFNSTTQGFKLNDVVGTAPNVNLDAPGTVTLPGDPPLLQWASEDYNGSAPIAGSMKLTATFSDWNQTVSPEVSGPVDSNGMPLDLTGKILHAQVYLQKGLSPNPSAPGGIVFYVKTGPSSAWGSAPWSNLTTGAWLDVTFDVDNPGTGVVAGFDPRQPVQLGFQLSSGGGGTVGAFGATPLPTVAFIDQITFVPNTCK